MPSHVRSPSSHRRQGRGRGRQPLQGRDGVLDRRRPQLLRREPGVEREHRRAGAGREAPSRPVAGLQTADGPATAVQGEHHWQRGGGRLVQPRRQIPDRQVDEQVHRRARCAGPRALCHACAHRRHVEIGGRPPGLRNERSELGVGERPRHVGDGWRDHNER